MGVILLLALMAYATAAQPLCINNDETLTCSGLLWTELPANASNVERMHLMDVSGTHPWNTSAFSAVNYVSVNASILMMQPLHDLLRLPHLSILHVSHTPVECWTDKLFVNSSLEQLMMVRSLVCEQPLRFVLNENMHELDLSENWLNTFPHVEGRTLTYLRLSGNNLRSVGNLSHVPSLFELDLSKNALGVIPADAFVDNTELVRLNLSSTSLETVSFVAPSLETLTLSSNYLTNVNRRFFSAMPNLLILDLTSNVITELADQFHNLTRLRQLHLSHNYIRELKPETLRHLQALEILKLDSNQLESLPHLENNLPCLHLLDISNNSITILDSKFFSHVPNLATLYGSFNGLRQMDDAAVALHSLKKLVLVGNRVHVDGRTFASLEQLNTLDLAENALTVSLDVLANNMALKDVDLRHNNISDVCGEQHLPLQLGNLNIAYNQITNLDCLESLYSLNLTGNPVVCGAALKLSLKEALYTDLDSEEQSTDTERVVGDTVEDKWVEVYKSVCSDDPLLLPDPPLRILPGDDDSDEDDDDDASTDDYQDLEDEMERHQYTALDDDDEDDDDDGGDDVILWKLRKYSGSKSLLMWAALGFAVFGFMLLSVLATVYIIVLAKNRRKRSMRSSHVSSYQQLKSPVYSETTSRVSGSGNFSANLGRVLRHNPVAGVFKPDGVLGKMGLGRAVPHDEMQARMIPAESSTSLA